MKSMYQTPQTDVMDLTLQGEVLHAALNNSVADTESISTDIESAPARKLYL